MTYLLGRLALVSRRDELEWQDDALCTQVDPELFFPTKGASTKIAKRLCGRCEVTEQCLIYALQQPGIQHGVWGGMSPLELREERRRRGLPDEEELADDESYENSYDGDELDEDVAV